MTGLLGATWSRVSRFTARSWKTFQAISPWIKVPFGAFTKVAAIAALISGQSGSGSLNCRSMRLEGGEMLR
jgi:hypothetical protein